MSEVWKARVNTVFVFRSCTDPQHLSVHLELPSSEVFCECMCQLRSPGLHGSEEEKHTPHGQRKLQREEGS